MMIGELRHRISIIEETATTDSSGFVTKSWIEKKKTWAKIEKNKQAAQETAGKKIQNETLIFSIRYQDISTQSRIEFGGKQYLIHTISDPEFSKKYLELTASEVI